jgi:hypothetical protein
VRASRIAGLQAPQSKHASTRGFAAQTEKEAPLTYVILVILFVVLLVAYLAVRRRSRY